MNFTTSTIMPFLTRMVIAAAMLTSGWVNCFEQVQIRPAMAESLQSMDIQVLEIEPTPPVFDEAGATISVESQETRFSTRGVNRIVWLLHDYWPELGTWGTVIAWTAAVSQVLAGVLLLIGLFTRLAALVVCVATGMAVFIVSGNIHGMFSMNPFDWPLDSHRFIQLFAGLGLFTLSLGLLLGGPGGLSLDRRYSKPALPAAKSKIASTKE